MRNCNFKFVLRGCHVPLYKTTREAMYVERNIEARSFKHCCSMKVGSIRYDDISNQKDAVKLVLFILF